MHPPALHSYPTDSKSLQDEEKGHVGESVVQEVGFNSSGKEEGEIGYYEEDAPHGVKKFMAMRGLIVSPCEAGRRKGRREVLG